MEHTVCIHIAVEPMKLGLVANEFFSSSLDGSEVSQVELEEENKLIFCLLLELIEHLHQPVFHQAREGSQI